MFIFELDEVHVNAVFTVHSDSVTFNFIAIGYAQCVKNWTVFVDSIAMLIKWL